MPDTSSTSSPSDQHDAQRPYRAVFCPNCGSPNTQTKNHGKKIGGALGTAAGVMSSLSGAAKGARVGAAIAFRIAVTTTPLNSVTAALLGALTGGAIGCAAGSGLGRAGPGRAIDETVLNNHLCLRCGHSFQIP